MESRRYALATGLTPCYGWILHGGNHVELVEMVVTCAFDVRKEFWETAPSLPPR